jgi:hypothetical protein
MDNQLYGRILVQTYPGWSDTGRLQFGFFDFRPEATNHILK